MRLTLNPWQLSLLFHLLLVGLFAIIVTKRVAMPEEDIIVPVEVEAPVEVKKIIEVEKPKVVLKSVNEEKTVGNAREVFGANRNSYTDDTVNDNEAVTAKKGNTVAKESDQEVLKDDDASSLPAPTEEYLVSKMPSVVSEVRPNYPKDAKDKSLEGAVIMDILIDEKGDVRQVTIVDGDPVFRPGALEAMKKFKFRPGEVEGKPVAVRIRYTLRFELEY